MSSNLGGLIGMDEKRIDTGSRRYPPPATSVPKRTQAEPVAAVVMTFSPINYQRDI